MIKKIFFHIGSHKTGTSSIQKFLRMNKKILKNNQSINYFDLLPRPFELHQEEHLNQLLKFKLDKLDGLENIGEDYAVISHEEFSWINREEDIKLYAKKLYEYANEVEIIIYLRRQDTLAISHKQQGAKGGTARFAYGHEPKALPTQLTPTAKMYLNFYDKIQKWSNAFGQENITVRIFERERLHNGDAVEDFCQVVGIRDYEKLKPTGHVNESISRIPQLFLHKVRNSSQNYFMNRTPEKKFLIHQMKKMSFEQKDKLLPARSEAIAFYEQFKEDNQKLNEWMGLTDNPFLFDDDFSHYPEEDNGYELSNDEIIEIFHQVIQNGLAKENKLSTIIKNTLFQFSKKLIKRTY